MSEKAAKSAFFTVIGGPAFSLVSTLAFPMTMQEATLQEINGALLHHFKPVNFEASERANFNALSCNPSDSIRNVVLPLKKQAAMCQFGAELVSTMLHCRRRRSWKSGKFSHLCGRSGRNSKSWAKLWNSLPTCSNYADRFPSVLSKCETPAHKGNCHRCKPSVTRIY